MTEQRERGIGKINSSECKTPSDVIALLKELFGTALEQMLEAEIEEHLKDENHGSLVDTTGNSRDCFNKKTLK